MARTTRNTLADPVKAAQRHASTLRKFMAAGYTSEQALRLTVRRILTEGRMARGVAR